MSQTKNNLPSLKEMENKEVAAQFLWRVSSVWNNRSKEVIQVGEGLPLLGFIARYHSKSRLGIQAKALVDLIVFRNAGPDILEEPKVLPLNNR